MVDGETRRHSCFRWHCYRTPSSYHPLSVVVARRAIADPEAELARLRRALGEARKQIDEIQKETEATVGAAMAGVFQAQQLMLEDPELLQTVEVHIRAGTNAEAALAPADRALRDQVGESGRPLPSRASRRCAGCWATCSANLDRGGGEHAHRSQSACGPGRIGSDTVRNSADEQGKAAGVCHRSRWGNFAYGNPGAQSRVASGTRSG